MMGTRSIISLANYCGTPRVQVPTMEMEVFLKTSSSESLCSLCKSLYSKRRAELTRKYNCEHCSHSLIKSSIEKEGSVALMVAIRAPVFNGNACTGFALNEIYACTLSASTRCNSESRVTKHISQENAKNSNTILFPSGSYDLLNR